MPQVSVLVAAYDAATTLGATLESVTAQEFRDWECVIVDDGSTDRTAEIAQEWAARDPRFRLIRLPHQGVVEARNAGIRTCRGDWIAILDADDHMDPRRLLLQMHAFASDPRLQVLGSHVRYMPRHRVGKGRLSYETWLNSHRSSADLWRDRHIEMPLAHPSMTIRADLLRATPYRDQGWPEDWDLLQRLFEVVGLEGIGVVPEALHVWTLRDDSLSCRSEAYTIASFTRCRAAYLASGVLAEHTTYALAGFGETGKALRKALTQEGRVCRVIYELHPGRIGQVIDGAEVHDRARIRHDLAKNRLPLLVSVSGMEARTTLRKWLLKSGLVEGIDFVCCA